MIGQQIIDLIIKGTLCHAKCAQDESHGCVVVWSSGADEQIDGAVAAAKTSRERELEELLRSACAIAERRGEGTHWQRFIASVNNLGLNGVTARTYRVLEGELLDCIRGRLKQHRDNLALWKSGALRPTVEDDEEQRAVMHDLCVAIAELETVLMHANEKGQP